MHDTDAPATAPGPDIAAPPSPTPAEIAATVVEDVKRRRLLEQMHAMPMEAIPVEPSTRAIDTALLAAQASIESVTKDSTATVKGRTKDGTAYEYKYDYAAGDDVLAVARRALHEQGLVLTPREPAPWSVVSIKIGRDEVPCLVGHFDLRHPESGEVKRYDVPMPIGNREPDKAIAGALTYLTSNFHRTLLQIPRTAAEPNPDPDKSGTDDRFEPRARPSATPSTNGRRDRFRSDDERREARLAEDRASRQPNAERRAPATVERPREPDEPAANESSELAEAQDEARSLWQRYRMLAAEAFPDKAPPSWTEEASIAMGHDAANVPRQWPLKPKIADYDAVIEHFTARLAEIERRQSDFDFGGTP